MPKEYIKLKKLNGQKARKKYYITNAVRHPAKADIPMMIWILEEFVKDGDIVLDPMAGIGTTLLEGMRLFPNSLFIGIELEHKFVKWANASIKKTERIAKENWFMEIGKAVCVQGDARDLQRVMKQKVDKIISSPPWGGQVQHKTNYLGKQKQESGFEYSEGPENIGNLPHGKIDKIVTSPPYSETIRKGHEGPNVTAQRDRWAKLMEERDKLLNRNWGKNRQTEGRLRAIEAMLSGYSKNPENIGNLKHGNIDKIITSPPFGQAQSGGGIAKKGYHGKHGSEGLRKGHMGSRSYMPENTGENKNNISNLPYVSKIITSPPYEETMGKKHHSPRADKLAQEKSNPVTYTDRVSKIVTSPPYGEARQSKPCGIMGEGRNRQDLIGYSYGSWQHGKTEGNIGNLKQQTYLEAMFLVYQQCFKVLKPQGLMILVVKDFIRNKKRIHLGEDTIKLCEMAGFKHIHTYHRKIENPSFWRVLYQQKHPEVEQIDCEDILCFKK